MSTKHSTVTAAALAALLAIQASHAQGLLDRLKRKADEVADAARELGDDIGDVTSADELAEDRLDAAERGIEREADSAADGIAPARPARETGAAEAEIFRLETDVERAATADERAADEARRSAAQTQRELDVESRARNVVRDNETVQDAQRAADGLSRADQVAAAEAARRVDAEIGLSQTEGSIERAGEAIEDLGRR